MRLVAWVYDPNWQKIGYVPEVKSASVTRVMDGAGGISIEGFATDENSLELLDNERRVSLHVEEPDGASFEMREIGRGIIRKVKIGATSSGYTLSLDGVDAFDELKRINTLFNRTYEDATVEEVYTSLAGLAGWGINIEPKLSKDLITARYDGSSILKALQTTAEEQGFHLRLGIAPGVVEVGHFGQQIPLVITNAESLPVEAYQNEGIAFIDGLTIEEDSEPVANRIYVLGAGQNVDAALTLEHSTRTNPYPVKRRRGPDNRWIYYIEDEDSITRYGLIERVVTFKEIAPIANNKFAMRRAANSLYDAAKTWLRQHAWQYISFSMGLKKCEYTIRPGDRVRVIYRGVIDRDGVPYSWKSFDAVRWVVKVTESIGTEGKTVRLEVANIDKHKQDAARIVVGTLEQISVSGIKAQPSFNRASYGPYRKEIDTTHRVEIPLTISDATHQLVLCRLRVNTTPFRATAAGAAAAEIPTVTSQNNGQHSHEIFFHTSDTPAGGTTTRQYAASDGGIGFINVNLPTVTGGTMWTAAETTGHTHDVEIPAHSHDLVYGINDDTLYPGLVKITVDGRVVVENLGSDTEGIEVEYDITEILNAGLQGTHRIVIECAEGQGVVEVEAELWEMILPIKLG